MEIEKDWSCENLRETITINSDNILILYDINLKTEQNLQVYVDIKNDIFRNYHQLCFANVMQALHKAEIIEMNVGMRFERKEEDENKKENNKKEDQGDWINFFKGIGQSIKTLEILIGDYLLNNSNLTRFGQELLKLNYLEKFHLQIGKQKNLDAIGFTQLGEALRRMTQLLDLSIIIGSNCWLGVNGAKKLFYGIEACEKIRKLKVKICSNNCLKSDGMQVISAAIGQLKQVSDFDLFIDQTNDIGHEGVQYITNNILQRHLSKSVERLSLVIDEMKATKEEIIVQMFTSIEGFTKLKDLSLEVGMRKEMNEYSIKIIQDCLKKLISLQRISISINGGQCPFCVTPMVDLLTRFQLADNLMNLQLIIPPYNEFNNSELSLFAVNLKRLQQLQSFSLEILNNNLKGNTTLKRKVPVDNNNRKTNQETTKQEEVIAQPRGISDIQESLSSLKQLEIVEWKISTKNDVSDGGWEMLSLSQSLRKFRVSIGEQCKLQDEGLRSLSKISSSISLEFLRIEVLDQNETSQNGWSKLLSSVNFEKMKDFKLFIGKYNECSKKSLGSLAEAFERTSPHIEYLSLDFKESNNINSDSIQQLADSLKSMVYLQQLVFIMPQYQDVNGSVLDSLSNNLEKMIDLKDVRIFFSIGVTVALLDEIKLCSAICSLRKLNDCNLQLEGNGSLEGSSIFSKGKPIQSPSSLHESLSIFKFRTDNGLQFRKTFKKQIVSQEEVPKLADFLAFSVLAQYTVYLTIIIILKEEDENCPQFTPIIRALSGFKKCIKLNLIIYNHLFTETSLNQLADSIVCMPFLSKLSLTFGSSVLSLKAAETLAAFFENSPVITKVHLLWKSNSVIDQSQAQLLLMSSILTCPHLKRVQVVFEFCSLIVLEFKNQQNNEDLPLFSEIQKENIIPVATIEEEQLLKKITENSLPQESAFQFIQEFRRKSIIYESLIHLGKFLMSTKLLKTINLKISSAQQISTEIASLIQEGIMNQANLTDLHLEFTEKCIVSREGAVLFSQPYPNQKNKINKTIKIKTDDAFSKDDFFSAIVSIFKDSNFQEKRNHLEITGTKFILTTDQLIPNRNTIFTISSPTQMALFQRILLDQSLIIQQQQIVDLISELRGIQNLYFNASDNIMNQDWSSFRQLSFLTHVSIKDKSSITSTWFLSLESSLSHMIHLKTLTLNLSHIHENLSSQEAIIVPFGKCLNNLKEITEFKITLKDFNFGEDGGQALGYGIEGMRDLEKLEIECINPQNLPTEGIKYLCEVISKSPQIQQLDFSFYGLLPSLEIPYFTQLKNQLCHKQKSLQKSSIQVSGEINQAFGSVRKFQKINDPLEINRSINHFYELQLPSNYCFESAFLNQAVNKCTDILQIFYSSNNEIYSIKNVTATFNFTKPKNFEPNLIFLKTLFSVLQHQQRRIKILVIEITLSQKGQFQFIYERALKDIKLVDIFYLQVENSFHSFPYEFSVEELYCLTSLDTLTNLTIQIKFYQKNIKQFRQRIMRKMKNLCRFQLF